MKQTIVVILLLTSSILYGQNWNKEDLIGIWKVEKIMDMRAPSEMPSEYAVFLNSSFEFKQNNTFNLTSKAKRLNEMMKNSHWKLNSNNNEILIQRNKTRLMTIKIWKKNEKTFFIIMGASLFLEMRKN